MYVSNAFKVNSRQQQCLTQQRKNNNRESKDTLTLTQVLGSVLCHVFPYFTIQQVFQVCYLIILFIFILENEYY